MVDLEPVATKSILPLLLGVGAGATAGFLYSARETKDGAPAPEDEGPLPGLPPNTGPLLLGAGAVILLLSRRDHDDEVEAPLPPPTREGQETIRALAHAAGLDQSWIKFLEAAAAGESGFNNLVARGVQNGAPDWAKVVVKQNDADKAKIAYDRNEEKYQDCGYSAARYSFGSGGWWQILPANGLSAFWDTEEQCMDPWAVFDPAPSMVMILYYLKRIQRYDNFKSVPTWGNLRVGMRAVSYLGRGDELERQRTGKNKLGDRLEQLGYDRSFVDEEVTPLPDFNPVDLLRYLEQTA